MVHETYKLLTQTKFLIEQNLALTH